jgi:hypothetical protein
MAANIQQLHEQCEELRVQCEEERLQRRNDRARDDAAAGPPLTAHDRFCRDAAREQEDMTWGYIYSQHIMLLEDEIRTLTAAQEASSRRRPAEWDVAASHASSRRRVAERDGAAAQRNGAAAQEDAPVDEDAPVHEDATFECRLCFEVSTDNHALVPCGHYNLCESCVRRVQVCPFCRDDFTSRLKLH